MHQVLVYMGALEETQMTLPQPGIADVMDSRCQSPAPARPGGRKEQGCCHMEGRGSLAEPVRGIKGRQAGTKALG